MIKAGVAGAIGKYQVTTFGDTINVYEGEELVTTRNVREFGHFIRRSGDIKLGLAYFDDFEVIYIYDRLNRNYGYAVNIQVDYFSEWGTAPF